MIGSQTYARRWVRYEIIKSLSRGNKLIGVHINGIPTPNMKPPTKPNGSNPFSYLGFQFSEDGTSLEVYEHRRGEWIEYQDYDGWILKNPRPKNYHGKFYRLSNLKYPVSDWQSQDGYKNFAKWVGD